MGGRLPQRCVGGALAGLALFLSGGRFAAKAEPAAAPPPPPAHTVANRREATVGEEVRLRVTLPAGQSQAWGIRVEKPPKGLVVKQGRFLPARNPGGLPSIELVVAPFDLSLSEIPSLEVQYTTGDGEPVSLHTEPQPIEIRRVTSEGEQQAEDILGPTGVKLSWWRYLLYLCGAIALALLARYLWRRRPQGAGAPHRPSPPAPVIAPHERALRELAELEREDLPARGQGARHCTRLSEIFRTYLEGRYGFLALEQTTEEIRRALAQAPLPAAEAGERTQEALELLDRWDLVKFARVPIEAETARTLLKRTRQWVEQTKPLVVPSQPAAPGGAPAQGALP